MELIRYLRTHNWPPLLGYLFFVGMMAVGYFYNLTFVQLGLVDLGRRVIGMSDAAVARHMALLAVITSLTGLLVGYLLYRTGAGRRLTVKLRLAFAVILVQTILTALAPQLRSEGAFLAWIVAAALALGVGVPVTFGMTVDLVPVRDRGYAAALITAAAYFVAATLANNWRIESFSLMLLGPMAGGVLLLAWLVFAPPDFAQVWCEQHRDPAFGRGRFLAGHWDKQAWFDRRLLALIAIMFAVYFIDSLGFLRLIETPVYMNTAWQSPETGIRLFIALIHVLTALAAGVLYTWFDLRSLFLWIFGVFALTHLLYIFHNQLTPGQDATLSMPALYATAVSLYTVVNFALWADLSSPSTISINAALGVALSAWSATFISTALAMQWRLGGMPLRQHLNLVDALAMLLFLFIAVAAYLRPRALLASESTPHS